MAAPHLSSLWNAKALRGGREAQQYWEGKWKDPVRVTAPVSFQAKELGASFAALADLLTHVFGFISVVLSQSMESTF